MNCAELLVVGWYINLIYLLYTQQSEITGASNLAGADLHMHVLIKLLLQLPFWSQGD